MTVISPSPIALRSECRDASTFGGLQLTRCSRPRRPRRTTRKEVRPICRVGLPAVTRKASNDSAVAKDDALEHGAKSNIDAADAHKGASASCHLAAAELERVDLCDAIPAPPSERDERLWCFSRPPPPAMPPPPPPPPSSPPPALEACVKTRLRSALHDKTCTSDLPSLERATVLKQWQRRVQISDTVIVHEIKPYSEIYGLHPREFVFDRNFHMIPALGFVALSAASSEADQEGEDIESDSEDEFEECRGQAADFL